MTPFTTPAEDLAARTLTPAEALTALHQARCAAREAFWRYADANLGAKGTEEERNALEKARDAASVKVDRAMSALLMAVDAAPGGVGKLRYPELDRRTVLYLLEYLGQTLYGDPERRREVIAELWKLT